MNTHYHYWELCRGAAKLAFVTDDFGDMILSPDFAMLLVYLESFKPSTDR